MRTLSEKMESGKRYVKHPDYKIGLDMIQEWIDECKLLEKQLKKCNLQNVSNNEVAVCAHKEYRWHKDLADNEEECVNCGHIKQTDC